MGHDPPADRANLAAPRGSPPQERSERRSPMLNLLRALFLILLVVFTALIILTDSLTPAGGMKLVRWWPLAVTGVLLFFGGIIALDTLIPKRKLSTITAIFVGLIAGVVVTAILGLVIDLFGQIYDFGDPRILEPFKVLLGLGICYLTISTVLQTQDDFRLVIPYVEFSKKIRGARPILLDTSALIDGRVLALAQTGVFQSSLIIPRYVIEELHRLSDSSDRLKRARGRRGLDAVATLQRTAAAEVKVEETNAPAGAVDQALVEQARNLPAMLLTTDQGLARVASIQGVQVLNLHDLAGALKAEVLPGDALSLRVVRRGEQPSQGVGFLDDGTMVVIEDGQPHIGMEVTATVTSAMQTSAGRLVFARVGASQGMARAETPHADLHPQGDLDDESHQSTRLGPSTSLDASADAAASGPADVNADTSQSAAGTFPAPPRAPRNPLGPHRADQPARSSRNPRRG